jgi:hypothetical protein
MRAAGPSIKPHPMFKKLDDYPNDRLLMVTRSNSFSATHPDLTKFKNKLVEARHDRDIEGCFDGLRRLVAPHSTIEGVGEAHNQNHNQNKGESGKPTRSWAANFFDSAKQTNFCDMAMALANKLANFNIVVEKWDSGKIGDKRGGSKGR